MKFLCTRDSWPSLSCLHPAANRSLRNARLNVARTKLLELIASLPPCLIGMEACLGANTHHCAREFQRFAWFRHAASFGPIGGRQKSHKTLPGARGRYQSARHSTLAVPIEPSARCAYLPALASQNILWPAAWPCDQLRRGRARKLVTKREKCTIERTRTHPLRANKRGHKHGP